MSPCWRDGDPLSHQLPTDPLFHLCRASVQSACQLAVAIRHQISTYLVLPRAFSRRLRLHSLVGGETRSNTTRPSVSTTSTPECSCGAQFLNSREHTGHFVSHCHDLSLVAEGHRGHRLIFVCRLSTDKLTKEEEEIYKLQHDLERTVISQQQSKKISEVIYV